jgi:hypothetical protein
MVEGMPESLPARIYLLAYDTSKRRLTSRGQLGVLVRAASLTELFLGGSLRDVEGRPCVEGGATGPVLTEIAQSRPHRWAYWVGRGDRKALRAVQDELVGARTIRLETSRFFGIFRTTRVVVLDPMVVQRLRDAVDRTLRSSGPTDQVDPVDAAMVALAAIGGLRTAIDRRTGRAFKSRIAELALLAGPAVPAVRTVIQARQAAAAAASTSV